MNRSTFNCNHPATSHDHQVSGRLNDLLGEKCSKKLISKSTFMSIIYIYQFNQLLWLNCEIKKTRILRSTVNFLNISWSANAQISSHVNPVMYWIKSWWPKWMTMLFIEVEHPEMHSSTWSLWKILIYKISEQTVSTFKMGDDS